MHDGKARHETKHNRPPQSTPVDRALTRNLGISSCGKPQKLQAQFGPTPFIGNSIRLTNETNLVCLGAASIEDQSDCAGSETLLALIGGDHIGATLTGPRRLMTSR